MKHAILALTLLLAACASAPRIHPVEAAHWLNIISQRLHHAQIAGDHALQASGCAKGCPAFEDYQRQWALIWHDIGLGRDAVTQANRGLAVLCGLQAINPNLDVPDIPPGLCEPYRQPAQQGR